MFEKPWSRLGFETKSSLASPDAGLSELPGAVPSAAGVRVTPRTAMTCAPVACAVNAISQAIGQLTVHTYKRGDDDARERAIDHPAYRLLRSEANPWTPASKFREEVTRDALLHPNGSFAKIIRVDEGILVVLYCLLLAGCAASYAVAEPPIVDQRGVNPAKFQNDQASASRPAKRSSRLAARSLIACGRGAITSSSPRADCSLEQLHFLCLLRDIERCELASMISSKVTLPNRVLTPLSTR